MNRILVAGSTGYLGGFVCRELQARGHFVRALARSPEKLAPLQDSLDEIVVAEVTEPETLEQVCDGIDVVFSSLGITRQREGLTFRDVDYQGNKNLLDVALRAGVRKFVYVSVFNGEMLRHLEIVDAHEAFVEALEASGLAHTVVRPTGYFSDMAEVFEMARRGRVWLIGSGTNRINPIHGADLAVVCADAIESGKTEITVGGPQTMTWQEMAKVAFEVLRRPSKVTSVPGWLMWTLVRVARLFSRHEGELLGFFTTMATTDVVAPPTGTRTLEQHFKGGTGMKVEDLSQFGKPLGMPKKAQRKMVGIVLTALREKFGLLGMAPFLIELLAEQRRIKKAHPDLVAKAAEIGPEVAKNLVLLPALFNVTARRDGREQAYEFVKGIFQRVAVHSMPAIYQIDELVQCEGDSFEGFKKFNVAMFEAMDRDSCDFNFYRRGTAPPTEHLNK